MKRDAQLAILQMHPAQFSVLAGILGTGEPTVSASGVVVGAFAFCPVERLWQNQKHQLNQNLSASQTLASAGTFVSVCDALRRGTMLDLCSTVLARETARI
jgi:hypothetical protein